MSYGFLADAVAVVHFGYVLFVVVGLLIVLIGGALGWRWVRNPWFRGLHLAAIAWVIVEHVAEWDCPLTTLEYHWRKLAKDERIQLAREAGEDVVVDPNEAIYDQTFVGRLLGAAMCMDSIGFDEPLLLFAHYGTAVLIFASMVLIPPRFRRQQAPVVAQAPVMAPLESTAST